MKQRKNMKNGIVGIGIGIPPYLYMVDFESSSAFWDQFFKTTYGQYRPTTLIASLKKVHHWVIWSQNIQQIVTSTFGWFTVSTYFVLQQLNKNTRAIFVKYLTNHRWPFSGEHLGCSTYHRWGHDAWNRVEGHGRFEKQLGCLQQKNLDDFRKWI